MRYDGGRTSMIRTVSLMSALAVLGCSSRPPPTAQGISSVVVGLESNDDSGPSVMVVGAASCPARNGAAACPAVAGSQPGWVGCTYSSEATTCNCVATGSGATWVCVAKVAAASDGATCSWPTAAVSTGCAASIGPCGASEYALNCGSGQPAQSLDCTVARTPGLTTVYCCPCQ
jgi:hypothetical protein